MTFGDERINESIKKITNMQVVINDLYDTIEKYQLSDNQKGATIKQLQEENQRLKEALMKVLNHWGKMNNPELCEDDYDNARKLIEP